MGNSQCVRIDGLDSYDQILTNAIGTVGALLKEGRTWRPNSWVKGRFQCWREAMTGIVATTIWHPVSASPTVLLDLLPVYRDPAASSILFSNYSNIHNSLRNSTLFLYFIFLCFLPSSFWQTTILPCSESK